MPDVNKDLTLSSEEMRQLGYAVIDQIIAHYEQVPAKPVTRMADRATMEKVFREPVPTQGTDAAELLERMKNEVFDNIMHLDHPRFFPFVPGPSNYISVLGDLLATGHNVFAGTWLESSSGTQIEMVTIDWLKEIIGFPMEGEGLFTSGGSMANFTALLVAREKRLKDGQNGVFYCSEQTHSSVERAVRLLGSTVRLTKIPVDDQFMIQADLLRNAIMADQEAGLIPIGVIGNAGTTNTGAVDNLQQLRELTTEFGMWLHVDGAYGCPGILSASEGHLFEGIARADSVTIDPHKWLFQPYEIGCVLVRERGRLNQTFSLVPEYLKDTQLEEDEVNFFNMGPQMTRSFRALKLWLSIKVFGLDAFKAAIEHGIQMARYFQEEMTVRDHWKVISEARLGIVNVRYNPPDLSPLETDQLNLKISDAVRDDGYAMVGTTSLNGVTCIRLCIINPRITREDLRNTADLLDRLAREINLH